MKSLKLKILLLAAFLLSSCNDRQMNIEDPSKNAPGDNFHTIHGAISKVTNLIFPSAYAAEADKICLTAAPVTDTYVNLVVTDKGGNSTVICAADVNDDKTYSMTVDQAQLVEKYPTESYIPSVILVSLDDYEKGKETLFIPDFSEKNTEANINPYTDIFAMTVKSELVAALKENKQIDKEIKSLQETYTEEVLLTTMQQVFTTAAPNDLIYDKKKLEEVKLPSKARDLFNNQTFGVSLKELADEAISQGKEGRLLAASKNEEIVVAATKASCTLATTLTEVTADAFDKLYSTCGKTLATESNQDLYLFNMELNSIQIKVEKFRSNLLDAQSLEEIDAALKSKIAFTNLEANALGKFKTINGEFKGLRESLDSFAEAIPGFANIEQARSELYYNLLASSLFFEFTLSASRYANARYWVEGLTYFINTLNKTEDLNLASNLAKIFLTKFANTNGLQNNVFERDPALKNFVAKVPETLGKIADQLEGVESVEEFFKVSSEFQNLSADLTIYAETVNFIMSTGDEKLVALLESFLNPEATTRYQLRMNLHDAWEKITLYKEEINQSLEEKTTAKAIMNEIISPELGNLINKVDDKEFAFSDYKLLGSYQNIAEAFLGLKYYAKSSDQSGKFLKANTGEGEKVAPGVEVSLDASGTSNNKNFSELTYKWEQTSGPKVQITDANTAKASFIAPESGELVFKLTVYDGLMKSYAEVTFLVK